MTTNSSYRANPKDPAHLHHLHRSQTHLDRLSIHQKFEQLYREKVTQCSCDPFTYPATGRKRRRVQWGSRGGLLGWDEGCCEVARERVERLRGKLEEVMRWEMERGLREGEGEGERQGQGQIVNGGDSEEGERKGEGTVVVVDGTKEQDGEREAERGDGAKQGEQERQGLGQPTPPAAGRNVQVETQQQGQEGNHRSQTLPSQTNVPSKKRRPSEPTRSLRTRGRTTTRSTALSHPTSTSRKLHQSPAAPLPSSLLSTATITKANITSSIPPKKSPRKPNSAQTCLPPSAFILIHPQYYHTSTRIPRGRKIASRLRRADGDLDVDKLVVLCNRAKARRKGQGSEVAVGGGGRSFLQRNLKVGMNVRRGERRVGGRK